MSSVPSNGDPAGGRDEPAALPGGEAHGLGRLMFAWRAALFRRALAILGDEAAADDAVQAALLAYWQRRGEPGVGEEPADRPSAFCMGILVKLALNERRERARRARLDAQAVRDGRVALPAPATDPAEVAIAGEAWELVLALPALERDILITRFGLGYTQQQTAEELGLALGTVKTRERRALKRLRKQYGAGGGGGAVPAVAVPSAVVLAERLASLGATPDDYASTVLPLSTFTLAGLVSTLTKGLLVMASANAMKSVGIAVVGIGCLVAVLFLLTSPGNEDRQRAPQQDEQARQTEDDSTREQDRDQARRDTEGERSHQRPAPPAEHQDEPTTEHTERRPTPPSEPEAAPADAPDSRTFVRGRVVSEANDEPLAGATVMLVTLSHVQDDPLMRNHTHDPRLVESATAETETDGTFLIEYGGAEMVAAVAIPTPPYAEAASHAIRLQRGETNDVGDIRAPHGGIITGRVVDRHGMPIEGARVRPGGRAEVRRIPGTPMRAMNTLIAHGGREARTDARGSYRMAGVREGTTAITVEAPGYLEQQVNDVEVRAGEATVVDVELSPAITLVVTVTDGQERAIADAEVVFAEGGGMRRGDSSQPVEPGAGQAFRARTNAAGEATLTGVTFLRGVLTVNASGFAPSRTLEALTLRDYVARTDVRLQRLATVTGRLLDARTQQGVTVRSQVAITAAASPAQEPRSLELDADGAFTLDNVPAGLVLLTFQAAGYRWAEHALNVSEGGYHALGDIVLDRSVPLIVAVTAEGEPVAGVNVEVAAVQEVGGRTTTHSNLQRITNTAGEATFDEFGGERVRIQLSRDGQTVATREETLTGSQRDPQEPIRVQIELHQHGQVVGVYRDTSGRPVAGRHIRLMRDGQQPAGHTRSDEDGRFAFHDVRPGHYRLIGFAGQFGGSAEMGANMADIVVRANETVQQDLRDPRQETYRITVLTHRGAPFANERISLGAVRVMNGVQQFRAFDTLVTDVHGRVEYAAAGRMAVPSMVRVVVEGEELLLPLVEQAEREYEARLPDRSRPSSLHITVTDSESDQPLGPVRVQIASGHGGLERRGVDVQPGGVEVPNLFESEYTVIILDPRYVGLQPHRVELEPGESKTVEIRTTTAVSQRILVHSQGEAPPARSFVQITATCTQGIRATSATGTLGRIIELHQLEAGIEYNLTIREFVGHQPKEITLRPGISAPSPLEVHLEPGDAPTTEGPRIGDGPSARGPGSNGNNGAGPGPRD